MTTSLHRLQISLPEWQVSFLAKRAEQEGISMAEVIRRLIQSEVRSSQSEVFAESIWEISGIAEDRNPLIDGIAVSERPELYLVPGDDREE